jgi:REP-associated tyrosine transposase
MAQSLSRILLHVIFSTKDRHEFLNDLAMRKEMHAFLSGTLKNRGATPI